MTWLGLAEAAAAAPTPCLSTGSSALDALLGGGGLPQGHVTEMVGLPLAGKTLVAVRCAAAAARAGHSVAIVDTCNGIIPERVLEAVLAIGGSALDLKRIVIVKAFDAPTFLAQIDAMFSSSSTPRLLVVDSATALIQPLQVGKGLSQAMAYHIVLTLRDAAVSHKSAVLLTNTMLKSFDEEGYHPALGQWWTHVPSVRIELTATEDGVAAKLHHSTLHRVTGNQQVLVY